MRVESISAAHLSYRKDLVAVDLAALWVVLMTTLTVLLIAGPNFTKLTLVGPLTAYDFCLLLLGTLSLGVRRSTVTNRSFILFALVVASYGISSLAANGASFNLLRQLAMFLYAAIGALIVSRFIDARAEVTLLTGLRVLAVASVVLQLAVGGAALLAGEQFGDEHYHYLSPASIVLNIVALGYVLSSRHLTPKLVGVPAVFLGLYMSGHASALLAGIGQLAIYALRPLPRQLQFAVALLGLLAVPLSVWWLVTANSPVLGGNAMWRLLFWAAIFDQVMIDKLGIFGHGFGVPYASAQIEYLLQVTQGYTTTLGIGNESFESTPHNFFVTVAFHLGFLPSMIFYVAMWRVISTLCLRRRVKNPLVPRGREELALGLALVGLSVWVAFNVVVELPHASLFFWLIFFLALQRVSRVRSGLRSSLCG
jgi:hypothetical protein